jgi:hypothetical protein
VTDTPGTPPAGTPAASGWRCAACGGWLAWNPAHAQLACRSCTAPVPFTLTATAGRHPLDISALPVTTPGHDVEAKCRSCGAPEPIAATALAGECSYCHAPWVVVQPHAPVPPPDGVVPASIDLNAAREDVARWVRSRRFAPNAFKSGASAPVITLAYQPVWVFGAKTWSQYTGERGDDYEVTVDDGDGESHTETRTTWRSVSGSVAEDFIDVPAGGRPDTDLRAEWRFAEAVAYDDVYLVGAQALGASVPLAEGWTVATQTMDGVIREAVRRDIGGDQQRITGLLTEYAQVTGAYLLAPAWSGTYSYHTKQYRIEINAQTGQVVGSRPYSAIKIAIAAILVLALVAGIVIALSTLSHAH